MIGNSDYSFGVVAIHAQCVMIGSPIGTMKLPPSLPISALSVSLIAQIHEHRGALRSMALLSPERLQALRYQATLESVGAGVRLGAAQLSDGEVSRLIGRGCKAGCCSAI
ncbi:MAG: hypothetical protein EBV69_12550 [Oxalobacteraceae bacterium]|nr:hypothetical protein [Oxalobacteraceae bacterium]